MIRRPPPSALAVSFLALGLLASTPADASDAKEFKRIAKEYEELAKNQDDTAAQQRRELIWDCFDYLDLKQCRKLLREAYEGERGADNRALVVEVLAASGEVKDLEFFANIFRREKEVARAPILAIGVGLGYTPLERSADAGKSALKVLRKAKGDFRVALLEGVGRLAEPSVYEDLLEVKMRKATLDERFEWLIALGACGGEAAVPRLKEALIDSDPVIEMGVALGLAATRSEETLPTASALVLIDLLDSGDPRVVEIAAETLGRAKHKPALEPMVEALLDSPLRTREELREALVMLTGKDYGHDIDAWRAYAASITSGKGAPKATEKPVLPEFFGMPVASDRVVCFLDLSSSMDDAGRIQRAREGLADYVRQLPSTAELGVYGCERVVRRFSEDGIVIGADRHEDAAKWIEEQLPARGIDLLKCLEEALAEFPDMDTIVYATDSYPSTRGRIRAPRETMEIFRRRNRTRGVRMMIAYVTPSGPIPKNDYDARTFEDRFDYLTQLAEEADGMCVHIDDREQEEPGEDE